MHNNFPICGALKKETASCREKEREDDDDDNEEQKKVLYIPFTL